MGEHKGIRFVATVDKVNENSKYYVMIIPESWVNTYKLNESGNKDYYDVLLEKMKRQNKLRAEIRRLKEELEKHCNTKLLGIIPEINIKNNVSDIEEIFKKNINLDFLYEVK